MVEKCAQTVSLGSKNWFRGYNSFSCSTQLSMKFYLLINSKLLISTVVFLLSLAECEIFYAYEYENANSSWHFHIYQQRKFHAQLS